MPLLAASKDEVFEVANAEQLGNQGGRAVTLVLTRRAVLIVSLAEDSVDKVVPLSEASLNAANQLQSDANSNNDPTLLRLQCSSPAQHHRNVQQQQRDLSPPIVDQAHASHVIFSFTSKVYIDFYI